MSVICQTFVQNAWRSDLCSNCFKCREEHDTSSCRSTATHRYMPQATSLYQSRGLSTSLKWRLSEPIYERVARRDFGSQTLTKASFLLAEPSRTEERRSRGILVTTHHDDRRRRSRSSVDFASEEALVIGYGGNDYDSDQSPWEMGSDDESIDLDLLDDNDDDRKITRMTRNNTEFNSSNMNLSLPPEKESKKDENKRNSINNNNNKTSTCKTVDRTLDILTYNDIQKKPPEKKLNQYYFPSSTEQHSFLHSKMVNEKTSNHPIENCKNSRSLMKEDNSRNLLKEDNSRSLMKEDNSKNLLKEDTNRGLMKEENNRNLLKEDTSRNLLKDEFTPLNTKTYSFVSELNKNVILSSEHSSDSDYSTCRLTAGDSTDSESFQDAEESRMLPCSSFLHGNFPPQPKVLLQQSLSSLESDKKYDAGSSTSGDVSNLSDDSDASEKTSFKSRNVRVAKTATDSKRPGKEVTFSDTQSTAEKKNSILSDTNQTENVIISSKIDEKTVLPKQKTVETSSNEKVQVSEGNKVQNDQNHKNSGTISISVDSKYNSKIHDYKTSPAPNPPVDINLRNIIAINGCATTPKENAIQNGHSVVTKTKSSPPRISKSPAKKNIVRTKSLDSVSGKEKKSHTQNLPEPKTYVDDYFYKDPSDDDDYEKSPEAINNRQSKLAALALELELARRDSAMKSNNNKTPQPSLPSSPPPPPEAKIPPPEENYPTIKKGSAISCTSRLNSNTLPDVLQETPTKTKKSRFSLKKLLKRNKDSGTFSPATKESNPKAWKKQTFDRSRLSLEIVHPMDLVESAPTEEGYVVSCHPSKSIFKGGYSSSRARSLSALPQVEFPEQSNCSLLECRKTDTLPAVRKAGTVAERKKNRPSLVRTPSCSAIPNRPASSEQRVPPAKPPPPPPKHKVAHPPPPPPPHHTRAKAPATPQRPPPPKIPEEKCRTPSGDSSKQDSDKEYANLGDIRSLLTPVKPQRPSALSAPHASREGSEEYATLQPQHEEDHYTYLDDTEVRSGIPKKSSSCGSVVSSSSSSFISQLGKEERGRRPWMDLQTSYAAIAATNYESLTEIIATSLNESAEYFRNAGKSLKWRDFALEADAPQVVLHNKCVYNAVHKQREKEKIMLMVSPRQQCAPPPPRTHPRFPVLASFSDHVPTASASLQWSTVHVLRRSRILTVSQFAQESAQDAGNQHVHLRDHCFLLLQVIHALKGLQAEGVEEVDCGLLRRLSVAKEDSPPPVFVLLPEDRAALAGEGGGRTLCHATLDTLLHLLQVNTADDLPTCKVNGDSLLEPVAHTFRAIARTLAEEKASSLTQAKGLLEYMLWGPVDLRECDPPADDIVLQRWLDLQRAQMVKSTITQLQNNSTLHVYEEYQLVFLLQASVKSLKSVISKL